MSRKNKALPCALLLLLLLCAAPIGCSAQLGGKTNPNIVKAEDGGEEEVLTEDEDRDEFGRPKSDGPEGEQGFIVAVAYLAMTAGSALLPFLFLL